jgi:hypothetical protein
MNLRLLGVIAGCISAALVLTACGTSTSVSQTISGPAGITLHFQGILPANVNTQNTLLSTGTRDAASNFALRTSEKIAAAQVQAAEHAKMQSQQHLSGVKEYSCMGSYGD